MKRIAFYLILIFTGNLALYSQSPTDQRLQVIVNAVEALKTKDKSAFLSCGFSKTSLKNYLLVLKNIKNVSAEYEKGLDSILDQSYPTYLRMLIDNYSLIIRKTKTLNWRDIILDSVQFSKEKINSGTIFMRYWDNSFFYKMNFEELLKSEGCYYLQSLYVPYADIGSKNRLITKDLKDRYIDSCMIFHKQQATLVKDKNLQEAIFGKCSRCTCEKQYVSETEQGDGVARVKIYVEISRPAKKK